MGNLLCDFFLQLPFCKCGFGKHSGNADRLANQSAISPQGKEDNGKIAGNNLYLPGFNVVIYDYSSGL
jgi:hypothetical protein